MVATAGRRPSERGATVARRLPCGTLGGQQLVMHAACQFGLPHYGQHFLTRVRRLLDEPGGKATASDVHKLENNKNDYNILQQKRIL